MKRVKKNKTKRAYNTHLFYRQFIQYMNCRKCSFNAGAYKKSIYYHFLYYHVHFV